MGLNVLLTKMSPVEKEIFEVWKEAYPSSAYVYGLDEYAGKILVPSKDNLTRLKRKIKSLMEKTTNKEHLKFLSSCYVDLDFFEPYMPPSAATGTFFYHLVKEGINVEHMKSLAKLTCESLGQACAWLSKKKWPVEVRIITRQKTIGLIGIVNVIKGDTDDSSLRQALDRVVAAATEYAKAFPVEGIVEGDFTEVFPILQKQGGNVGRRRVYPRILRDQYDYPETPDEVEEKALKWLRAWMPRLIETTRRLAEKYGVSPEVQKVEKEMAKRRCVPKAQLLDFVKELRSVAQKVFDKHIVRITPKYVTRVIETPSYLVNFIPSGAASALNMATDDPFNLFFVTTDEKRSPATTVPDLMQLVLHEEYGHCVNFSNSATAFGAEPSPLSILDTMLSLPISDGIAFYRELEFVNLLKDLVKRENLDPDERRLLEILRGEGDDETMILENEFVMLTWRVMRFLRAVFDVRVNMGKQTIAEFLEWASRETGLSLKKIYDQTFLFLATVGYAPCYSMAGEALRELQELAVKNGKAAIDFNTYASSLGFPGRTIFEEKLYEYAISK